MASASERYNAMVAAYWAQQARIGQRPDADRWSGAMAERFRSDPRREPEGLLQELLDLIKPDDVVLDVGGGGGRFGLAIALHCRELIDIDPSAGMHAVFDSVAKDAGIMNAHYVQEDWLEASDHKGDVCISTHVTYFVKDIEKFIHKLGAAARRLIAIDVTATPNPNRTADVFEAVWGEKQALVPGYQELLPVLWEMGILPEVRVLAEGSFLINAAADDVFKTRSDAIASAVAGNVSGESGRQAEALEANFDRVFAPVEGGFQRRYRPDQRQVLITWNPQ